MRGIVVLLTAAQGVLAASALPVPTTGLYLGVWSNPNVGSNQEQSIEILEGPAPNGINHRFALHLVYYKWTDIAARLDSSGSFHPDSTLQGDIAYGRVPVISWGCDQDAANSDSVIAGGDAGEDATINATAQALKQYPGPVMLRWFWEFNDLTKNQGCRGDTGGAPTPAVYNGFIGAWQHIWTLFQKAGATNVVFLWNASDYPNNPNRDPHGYYPGNAYVDWIGVDTYQRTASDTFATNFGQFYSDFSNSQYGGKPLMAGENGAIGYSVNNSEIQAGYLQGLAADIKSGMYPLLKAYEYFNAPGNAPSDWVLDTQGGLAEFATIASSGGFVPVPGVTAATPSISLVANAEGEAPVIAPNTWVEIKGANLAPFNDSRIWQSSDFVKGQMPASLDGVSVTVNGKAAYVYYISPSQVNVVTPPDALSGAAQVVVTNSSLSASATAQTAAISPSFFVLSDNRHIAAVHANGGLLGPSSFSVPGYTFTPAQPGETVMLYANGFGPTSVPVVSGSSTQSGTLAPMPSVSIGGVPATVVFAGLVSPGLFQFNVTIAANTPGGDEPIVATYNGASTQAGALLSLTGTAPPTTVTFYVAPNGNDSWSGTMASANAAGTDGPFATFERARAAVQALNNSRLTQITVQFRAGTYYLSSTEMMTTADSGSATLQILYENYPGEKPVFSGGVRVQNWTNVSGNTWKTTLPASTQYFENLFYNGVRRLRPRLGGALGTYYRNAGPVYLQGPAPPANPPDASCSEYFAGSGWECFDRFQYQATDPISSTWKNLAPPANNHCGQPAGNAALAGDIELVNFEQYTVSKLRVSCVDAVNHIVYLTGATATEADHPTSHGFIPNHRYLIENVEDALTLPGQWFLDRSTTPWTLTYLANAGENPNADSVIVPQVSELFAASGLQYVTFQGLTFEHDNYTMPAAGYNGSAEIIAAVSFQNTQHITVDSVVVAQTSGTGIEFISCIDKSSLNWCIANHTAGVAANNTIQNSAFYDLGAGGIRIGTSGNATDTNANVPQSNIVQNTVVEGYGRVFPGSKGISQGQGHDNLYTHNDVYDGYKGAIKICYCANSDVNPPFTNNNVVSFNHVYNLFQGIMNDSGSIYMGVGTPSPPQSGTGNKMLNNKVHDVNDASVMDSDGYGGDGLYADDFSGQVDMENNLVYRVSGNAISFSGPRAGSGQSSTVKNNILAFAQQSMLNAYDPYSFGTVPPLPMFFTASNNLMYFDRRASDSFYVQGGCTYAGEAYTNYEIWSSNLFWRTDGAFATDAKAFHVQQSQNPSNNCGDKNSWTNYAFAGWQGLGEDVQSVVQNPGFNNPAYPADDYSLPKGSPGAGFVVFDPNQAGRTNPMIMPPAVAATFPTKTFNPATDF